MYFAGLTAEDGYVVFRTDGDILDTVVALGQDRPASLTAAGEMARRYPLAPTSTTGFDAVLIMPASMRAWTRA